MSLLLREGGWQPASKGMKRREIERGTRRGMKGGEGVDREGEGTLIFQCSFATPIETLGTQTTSFVAWGDSIRPLPYYIWPLIWNSVGLLATS